MTVPRFDRLIWEQDQVRLGDIVFLVQAFGSPIARPPRIDGRTFVIYKTEGLIGQYSRFWTGVPDFDPRRVFEVGIWAGGSVILWTELLQPERLVAIDLAPLREIGAENAQNLQQYLEKHERQVRLFWETDQADTPRLRHIAREELQSGLDLVIDDASHWYVPTRSTFETLFPLVRPGGWYVIEDWRWDFHPLFRAPDHPWAMAPPLSPLILELVELLGSAPDIARTIRVSPGAVFVERGTAQLDEGFRIEGRIARPPHPSWLAWHAARARSRLSPRRLWWVLHTILRQRSQHRAGPR